MSGPICLIFKPKTVLIFVESSHKVLDLKFDKIDVICFSKKIHFSAKLGVFSGFDKSVYVRTHILISLMIVRKQFCLCTLSYAKS